MILSKKQKKTDPPLPPLPPPPGGGREGLYIFYRFIRFIRNALSLSEAPLEASKNTLRFLSEKRLFLSETHFLCQRRHERPQKNAPWFLSERMSGGRCPLSEMQKWQKILLVRIGTTKCRFIYSPPPPPSLYQGTWRASYFIFFEKFPFLQLGGGGPGIKRASVS